MPHQQVPPKKLSTNQVISYYTMKSHNYTAIAPQILVDFKRRNLLPLRQTNKSKLHQLRKKSSNCSVPDISVIGVSKIKDQNYFVIGRIIWFIILLTVTGLCCWQLWICTANFFANPIIKDIEIVSSTNVNFPAVYLCSGVIRNSYRALFSEESLKCNYFDDSCSTDPIVKLAFGQYSVNMTANQSVEYLWNTVLGIEKNDVKIYQPCEAQKLEDCKAEGLEWKEMKSVESHSFWGTCLTLDTAHSKPYKGPFTSLTIVYSNSLLANAMEHLLTNNISFATEDDDELKIGALLSLHDKFQSNAYHYHFYSVQEIFQGFITHIEMRVKKFKVLNTSKQPCDSPEISNRCLDNCFEKKFANRTHICRMPYIHSKNKPLCTLGDSYREYHLQNYEVYSNFSFESCNCPRTCNKVFYSTTSDVIDKLKNQSSIRIKLYFSENAHDVTTEKYAYEFSALISDIGGNLGFFLGFCVLTIAEIIEFVVYWITVPNTK